MTESYSIEDYRQLNAPAKTSKYRAKKTVIDGIKFDSKAEAAYYGKLNLMVRSGEITGFDCQVPFPLIVNGELIANYIADFLLYYPDGSQRVVDVKGVRKGRAWDIFTLKRKLLKATLGIDITIES